jgi:hypothetical protein
VALQMTWEVLPSWVAPPARRSACASPRFDWKRGYGPPARPLLLRCSALRMAHCGLALLMVLCYSSARALASSLGWPRKWDVVVSSAPRRRCRRHHRCRCSRPRRPPRCLPHRRRRCCSRCRRRRSRVPSCTSIRSSRVGRSIRCRPNPKSLLTPAFVSTPRSYEHPPLSMRCRHHEYLRLCGYHSGPAWG